MCVFVFWHATQHVGSEFPDQGLNLRPLQWKHQILTTGSPGKSPCCLYSRPQAREATTTWRYTWPRADGKEERQNHPGALKTSTEMWHEGFLLKFHWLKQTTWVSIHGVGSSVLPEGRTLSFWEGATCLRVLGNRGWGGGGKSWQENWK